MKEGGEIHKSKEGGCGKGEERWKEGQTKSPKPALSAGKAPKQAKWVSKKWALDTLSLDICQILLLGS